MAWTVTAVDKTVFGNKRVNVFRITTDSAEQLVDSGMPFIDYHMISPVLVSDATFAAYPNSGTTGTALAGQIGFSGCGTGDIFFLHVYGH